VAQLTLSDYKNNLFSNHFLEERIQKLEEWQETDFEEKFDVFKKFYQEKEGILSENLNEDQTQENFIDPILRKLGHDWVTEASKRVGSRTDGKNLNPDYGFMSSSDKLKVHQDDEEPLEINYAVGDAKSWGKKLDKSSQDHTNPAFQIYNYVDRLRADWGILTNGKKWRLYSYEDCAADIYFEVDLESILAGEKTEEKLEVFKYFYLFFRAESFEEGFLEEVYQESVEYNEGLEDDLEDKVYDALEVAVEGFFETNDIEKTDENIDLVHHSSLIFLYRVLFILNAESRDLLPTDDEAYRQAFGLTQLKRMIIDDEEDNALFQDTTVAWDNRLSRLFEGIDDGYDLHETEIPAYNGGLFDEENGEENQFLAENKLYGSYIKEILELLATNYDEEKSQRVILDYKDLNIRHLGSVYEGLLEHKFKAADERKVLKNEEWKDFSEANKDWESFEEEQKVEENELYLTNESGERKATGSYYTPEYIVEYIVENTVGPKVEEKIEEAEENNENVLPKVLELNVCDPAMGSGHFLTEATEFIAENIVEHADLKNQDIDENEDELNWAKRQVVQNCIYGVDINELAVELGKLSLWIETMAEGKPLNFLDHHLKHGNSLIGSNFDEIFSHPTEDQKRLDSERYQFGDPQDIKESFQEQYLEIEQMPEDTVEHIHEKEKAYKQFISNNTLYQQFQQLANIHTRQYFEKEANSSDYESFLINIGNPGNPFENTEWYKNAQSDAEDRNYFHWQLEFPKVFFGQTQGFDAVVGNPPYLESKRLPKERKDNLSSFFESCTGKFDLFIPFIEQGLKISEDKLSFITPSMFMKRSYGQGIREFISQNAKVNSLADFKEYQVFPSVTTFTCVFELGKKSDQEFCNYYNVKSEKEIREIEDSESKKVPMSQFTSEKWDFIDKEELEVLNKIDSASKDLSEKVQDISVGIQTGKDEVYLISNDKHSSLDLEDGIWKDLVRGRNMDRWSHEPLRSKVFYPYDEENNLISEETIEEEFPNTYRYLKENKSKLEGRSYFEESDKKWYELWCPRNINNFLEDKILVQEISNRNKFAVDRRQKFYNTKAYGITSEDLNLDYLVALLNSRLLEFQFKSKSVPKRGGYFEYKTQFLYELSIIENSKFEQDLASHAADLKEKKRKLHSINLNLTDYIGTSNEDPEGKSLGELYMPVEGLSEKIVSDTSADRDSLRIGGVGFEESNDELVLKVSARYKPDDSEGIDKSELDRWGYFETEKVPAMKFNVEDKMRPLIEEFVSLAVDEAGGFAGFRESATKTNSVIDRLEKLTLPKLEDVEQGLEKFIDNREDAEELEEEIQETDELIDAIVFDLYDLTEEEVETVLDSLDTSEGEKASILEKFRQQ
jgi:hypothetical protein